jgi:hypothetical protein
MYSGIACEISDAELKQRQQLRSSLLSTLRDSLSSVDVSVQSMVGLASSLSSVTQNPFEISFQNAKTAQYISRQVIANCIDLGVRDGDSLIGVLQSMDAIATVGRYNYNPYDLRMNHSRE